MRLLHAGEIYARRNPAPLFQALAALNRYGPNFRLHLLGRCDADLLSAPAWRDFVSFAGQRTYQETLEAMQQADILVLFDSPGRTIGVPAKLYEYLGAGRPVLALAEPAGDTATILRDSGVLHRLASPNDAGQIQRALRELAQAIHRADSVGDPARLQRFTRRNITGALARRLDGLVGQPTVSAARIDSLFDRSASDEVVRSPK
jgi:glycosyltransferase involved in cell wall biosynthesis